MRAALLCLLLLGCGSPRTPATTGPTRTTGGGTGGGTGPGPSDPSVVASGCDVERTCGPAPLTCRRPDALHPCGAAGCDQMQRRCGANGSCPEGQTCTACPNCMADRLCAETRCQADADCASPNFICTSGSCTARPCTASSQCSGFCVDGACFNRPGWCEDTSMPPPP